MNADCSGCSRIFSFRALAVLALASVLISAARAEENWRHYLPPKTLAVVEVADLPQAEAALARVVKSRGLKLLSLVETIEAVTGRKLPLDDGPLVVGLAETSDRPAAPFALLPSPLLEEFSAAVGAEQTGRLALFRLAGADLIAVDAGPWVFVTASSDQQLAPPETPADAIKLPSARSIQGCVRLHWTETGWKRLLALASQIQDEAAAQRLIRFGRVGAPKSLSDAITWLAANRTWFEKMAPTFDAGVIAIDVSGPKQVKLTIELESAPHANASSVPNPFRLELLAGSQPLIATLDSNFSPVELPALVKGYLALLECRSDQLEIRRFERKSFAQFADEVQAAIALVDAYEWRLRSRTDEQPLAANQSLLVAVSDTQEFLESVDRAASRWNAAIAAAESETKLEVNSTPLRREGFATGRRLSVDMVASIGGPRIPEVVEVFEKFFGPRGEMVFRVLPIDEKRVLICDWPVKDFNELIGELKQAPAVKLGAKPQAASVTGELRLDRYVEWQNQINALSMAGAIGAKSPRTLKGPVPVKFRISAAEGPLVLEAELPTEALDALLDFTAPAKN
jgi:hypothetical protein